MLECQIIKPCNVDIKWLASLTRKKEILVSVFKSELEIFYSLSEAFTGFDRFDLLSTGMGEIYFQTVLEQNQQSILLRILQRWSQVDSRCLIESEILSTPIYMELVQKITMLWYTGSWYMSHDSSFVIEPRAYKEGLMWKAAGTHTVGAQPQGFGAWALPPQNDASRKGSESENGNLASRKHK
jgi:hypothetical protein